LLGEAIVINRPSLQPDFRYHIKQRGGLLAKGSLLGAQFVALFNDGLYFELARHANAMAQALAGGLKALGYDFAADPVTNLIFPILPNALVRHLEERYDFYVWRRMDGDRSAIRLVTSWATPVEKVNEFLDVVRDWRRPAGNSG